MTIKGVLPRCAMEKNTPWPHQNNYKQPKPSDHILPCWGLGRKTMEFCYCIKARWVIPHSIYIPQNPKQQSLTGFPVRLIKLRNYHFKEIIPHSHRAIIILNVLTHLTLTTTLPEWSPMSKSKFRHQTLSAKITQPVKEEFKAIVCLRNSKCLCLFICIYSRNPGPKSSFFLLLSLNYLSLTLEGA